MSSIVPPSAMSSSARSITNLGCDDVVPELHRDLPARARRIARHLSLVRDDVRLAGRQVARVARVREQAARLVRDAMPEIQGQVVGPVSGSGPDVAASRVVEHPLEPGHLPPDHVVVQLCGFVQGAVTLLGRIVDAMWEDAKANARWISIDATGVLVFALEKCRHAHFWVMVAERQHVLFRFTKTHNGGDPAKLLEGYRGYVIADASAVYHELYRREPGIIEVGCWAHARRGAFEALSSDEPRALVLIGFIGLLYDAHMLATDPKTRVTDGAKRKADAAPVIDRIYAWIKDEYPNVADETHICKAMNYIVNH
jgi:hypothetical protein